MAYHYEMHNEVIEKYLIIFITAIGILVTLKLYRFWLNALVRSIHIMYHDDV